MQNNQINGVFFYPRLTKIGKLRDNALWKWLIIAVAPIFEAFWEYIWNFNGKISFWLSGFAGIDRSELRRKGIEIKKNDPEFTRFANWLRSQISEDLLATEKQKILNQMDPEIAYIGSIENVLDEETRAEIVRFSLSDHALSYVLPYFRVTPRLGSIHLMYNIVRTDCGQEGSKQWHRDGNQYKALNIFMSLCELDENSGMYSAISQDKIAREAIIPLDKIDTRLSGWINTRISDDQMSRYVRPTEEVHFKGAIGTTALVDPGLLYHKGGHCKKRDRLMLQISYVLDAHTPTPSFLKKWRFSDSNKIKELLNTRLRRKMMSGDDKAWYRRLGIGNPIYTIGRKILSYHLQPLK